MKKLLICALAISAAATFADVCTVSIDGMKSNNKVFNADSDNDTVVLKAPGWGDEKNRTCRIIGNDNGITSDDYTEVSVSFKPEKDGKLGVLIYGNYAADKADRKWIYVKDIRFNGKPAFNSDYAKLKSNGLPQGFYGGKGLKLVEDNGEKVLYANHDNRVGFFTPQLKADEVCNMKFLVKAVK